MEKRQGVAIYVVCGRIGPIGVNHFTVVCGVLPCMIFISFCVAFESDVKMCNGWESAVVHEKMQQVPFEEPSAALPLRLLDLNHSPKNPTGRLHLIRPPQSSQLRWLFLSSTSETWQIFSGSTWILHSVYIYIYIYSLFMCHTHTHTHTIKACCITFGTSRTCQV